MNNFVITLLQNSLFLSIAILLLTILSQLLQNKTSPRVRLVCWIIIALGLLIPFRPTLFSVTIDENSPAVITNAAEQLEKFTAWSDTSESSAAQQSQNSADSMGVMDYTRQKYNIPTIFGETGTILDRILKNALSIVWVLGVLVFITVCVVRHIRFSRSFKRWSVPASDERLLALMDSVRADIKLKRRVKLSVCPIITTPVLVGLFHPTIILPDDDVDDEKLRFMLTHEALHCKRGDIWTKALSLLAMAVHWFNPLVYLMNRSIATESERACDAAVLRTIGTDKRFSYGDTVLYTAKRGRQATTALSSAFSGSGKNLKKRLLAIVDNKMPKRWVAICCAAVMVTGLIAAGLVGCEQLTSEGVFVPIPQTEIDLTPTNELVIYVPDYNFLIKDIMPAIVAYKDKYPEINVIVETIKDEGTWPTAYSQRVNTELLAGGGPDIIITYRGLFSDLNKTMDSGAFLDLSSIMDEDKDFRMEDYYQPILDAGLYKGGRYLVPYSYRLTIATVLQSALEESGFDLSKSTGTVSFFNELAKCLPELEENWRYKNAISDIPYIINAYYYAGIDLIDYENRKVMPDEAGFKAFCEAYKPYAKTDHPIGNTMMLTNYNGYEHLKTGNSLFAVARCAFDSTYYMREAKEYGDSMAVSAIPSMDGGLNAFIESGLAVSSTSKNQLNAWNFIKVMLSEEIQQGSDMGGPTICYPVNRNALRNIINYYNDDDIPMPALTQEEIQPFYDLLDNITGCSLINNTVDGYCYSIMQPYFLNEKSYDECVTELRRKLQLYLDE